MVNLLLEKIFNEVFQSGLDQTFKIENTFHPLNSLNSDEIKKTFDVINRSKYAYKNMRFAELKLKEPEKPKYGITLLIIKILKKIVLPHLFY